VPAACAVRLHGITVTVPIAGMRLMMVEWLAHCLGTGVLMISIQEGWVG
jgi:hypothetical protein